MGGETQACEEGTMTAGPGISEEDWLWGLQKKKKKKREVEPTASGVNKSWVDSDEQEANKESFFSPCYYGLPLAPPTDRI